MYEKILVPLDGSELSEVALPYARELAARLGSRLTLLYVSESAGFEDDFLHMHKFYIQKMAENIEQEIVKKRGNDPAKKINIDSKILTGKPAEEIISYADEEKMGMIIMSTHGRTGIGRWAIGSVADKVIKAASRPVYLIRARGATSDMREKDKLNKVLVPLDGSKKSEVVIPYVEELASKLKTEVILLQALAPDYGFTSERQLKQFESERAAAKSNIKKIAARLQQKGINTRAIFKEAVLNPTDIAQEINSVAADTQVDLVAMSTRGSSASSSKTAGLYFKNLGSITEKMVHSGNTPLLLVKPD
jgi:nucleotide-binding universal stress UspA family protein